MSPVESSYEGLHRKSGKITRPKVRALAPPKSAQVSSSSNQHSDVAMTSKFFDKAHPQKAQNSVYKP
ncbi:hypothetical protein TIFTF001_020837 [Ficus carica]|uniref:Uncharacterized protein n=1 Tax=Ficus carica TaxID=3494 RepID=A0AA88DE19_FICCA|nr:hypothetical protein TIFTF001_020837 [Ficus carica]